MKHCIFQPTIFSSHGIKSKWEPVAACAALCICTFVHVHSFVGPAIACISRLVTHTLDVDCPFYIIFRNFRFFFAEFMCQYSHQWDILLGHSAANNNNNDKILLIRHSHSTAVPLPHTVALKPATLWRSIAISDNTTKRIKVYILWFWIPFSALSICMDRYCIPNIAAAHIWRHLWVHALSSIILLNPFFLLFSRFHRVFTETLCDWCGNCQLPTANSLFTVCSSFHFILITCSQYSDQCLFY